MTTKEERLSAQRAKLRWCVHMLGPDELIPMASFEAAEKYADDMNNALHGRGEPMPDVLCLAQVVPCLWSREQHAEQLAKREEIDRQYMLETTVAGERQRP